MPITLKQQHNPSHALSIEQLNIKKVLQSIKKQTQKQIDKQTISDIKSSMILKQSTTYELMLLNQQEYIAHQFTKLGKKQFSNQSVTAIDVLTQKFLLSYQLSTDKSTKIVTKNLSPQNFTELNHQLKEKLAQITYNINTINKKNHNSQTPDRHNHPLSRSFSVAQKRQSSQQNSHKLASIDKKRIRQNLSHILQFKQPGYWLKNQQKTKKIKQFLQHHQKQHQQRHKRYQQSVQKSLRKVQQQKHKQKQSKIQNHKQILRKGLQKSLQYKQKRQNLLEQHENQLQKIDQFLQKLNPNQQNKRLYELLQQNYKQHVQKQQQQYQQKLLKIKQLHTPLDQQQLQQHIQKYQQYKQSLKQQNQQKKQQFNQHLQQIKQQLSNLYHSKKYKKVAQQTQSPYKRSFSQIVKRKTKKKQFAQSIKQKHKPNISEKKKQQLQQSIRLLQLSEDKNKRKVFRNGQIQYEEKEQIDRRKKGLEYLAYLRKYLQGKPKKQQRPISTSVELNSYIKKIDYLRENKPNIKFKESMIEWKKVMDDDTFKPKDKYIFVKESISTLQHKAIQKQIQARNLKKSPQELQKKDQFDKYYIQSIQAKMAILNNLMLGNVRK